MRSRRTSIPRASNEAAAAATSPGAAADYDVSRAVDGRDGNGAGDIFRAAKDRGHGARFGPLHQLAADRDQIERLLEREYAGHARSRELAEAVAHDDVRLDAPASPQLAQRVLEGEHGRLRVAGVA